MKLIKFKTINSTNTYALNRFQELEDMTAIAAKTQTDGRGRFERKWLSPDCENIYLSIVLKQIKKEFAKGDMLQALVAIKCLDEGVNIPSIKTAFILASSTNPKEYIQRRGRVLRKFPGKEYAIIFDFITLPFSADTIGSHNPDVVSSSKGLVKRELIRMLNFAEISENPSETYDLIYELKLGFGITEEDLKEEEEQSIVV